MCNIVNAQRRSQEFARGNTDKGLGSAVSSPVGSGAKGNNIGDNTSKGLTEH